MTASVQLPSRETIMRFVVSVAPPAGSRPAVSHTEYMRRWRRQRKPLVRSWRRRPELAGLVNQSLEYKAAWTRLKREGKL